MAAQQDTVGDLLDQALDYADMQNSDFPDSTRLYRYFDNAAAELYDLLVQTHEDYFRTDATFTLVSGTEAYDLPDDFYKSLGVFYVANNRRWPVRRWQSIEIGGLRSSPVTGGTVEMWYVPQLARVRNRKTIIPIPAIPTNWHDFIPLHIATRLLKKEQNPDAPMIEKELEKARALITRSAEVRDEGEVDSIGDVSGRWGNAGTFLNYQERFFQYRIMANSIRFIQVEYLGV